MDDTFNGAAEAERRIAAEAVAQTGFLDLTQLGLSTLPESLFDLIHLKRLHLGRTLQQVGNDWFVDFRATGPRNTGFPDLSRLGALSALEALSVNGLQIQDLHFIAYSIHIKFFDCSDTQVSDLTPLARLTALQSLTCWSTPVADLTPLAKLTALQSLDFTRTQVSDLTPLARLTALQSLNCSFTQVSNLTPLASLTALQSLDFSATPVTDLTPLAKLTALQSLNCSFTQVADLTPLARLTALQSLDCHSTPVTDLTPLARLTALQSLDCHSTQVTDLTPLARLTALQSLDCSFTQVADLAPLARLTALQSLNCSFTQVSNLTPLASLTALQSLDFSATPVSNLTPLASLTALQSLDFSATPVTDLTPLARLTVLQSLNCSECCLQDVFEEIWQLPSLERVRSYRTTMSPVPGEVLSQSLDENCLPRLRAWLRDSKSSGAVPVTDVKLLILGNGGAGKTQLSRRLRGEPFDPAEPSTHGIQVSNALLPGPEGQADMKLALWDFGGQDIYHGAHALFVRSRSVFLLAWSRETEPDVTPHYTQQNLRFANMPLAYWVDYVRHVAGGGNPMLVAQTKCDLDGDRDLPVGTPNLPASVRRLHTSAHDPNGLDELKAALRTAIGRLWRDQGIAQIPRSWTQVQAAIEAGRNPDGTWPAAGRTMTLTRFNALCEQTGQSGPPALLQYLHNCGVVFYQDGLFGNRIILDQQWALDAIYAVFDRQHAVPLLRSTDGWFIRPQLEATVWRGHPVEDQHRFLDMMLSCGICFIHTRDDQDPDRTRYVAPDLLPERAEIETGLQSRWVTPEPVLTHIFRYPLLHRGVTRALLSHLGQSAGLAGTYWRGGMFLFDQPTASRAILEEAITEGWRGTIRLQARGPNAALLLQRLAALVREKNQQLGLTPEEDAPATPTATIVRSAQPNGRRRRATKPSVTAERPPARSGPDPSEEPETPIRPGIEPPSGRVYAVSYAWNDQDGGPDREAPVKALEAAAKDRAIKLLRDKNEMTFGDSIREFMRQLVQAERLIVILSAKYLRSPYCMTELYEVWRLCESDKAFRQRVRVFSFGDEKIADDHEWAAHADHWEAEYNRLKPLAERGRLTANGYQRFLRINDWCRTLPQILETIKDTLRPKKIEDLLTYAFDDPPTA